MRAACALLLVGSIAHAQISEAERQKMFEARMMASQRASIDTLRKKMNEPLAPEACGSAKVFRGIYKPSFSLPCVVTFELSPTHARLSVRSPSGNSPDGGLEFGVSEAELTPEASGALLEKLTNARPRELGDQAATGTDGIALMGTVCSPGEAPHHFVGWDYKPSRRLDWFRALIDASRASLPLRGAFAAERTLEYLAPPGEFIHADDPGPPRTIRLVAISIGEAEPFRALCASVKPDEDLIIDLRNFSGAGTMFKPDFIKLDRRKGRTLWVAHPELAKHLIQNFGVTRAHFVDSLELAQKRFAH